MLYSRAIGKEQRDIEVIQRLQAEVEVKMARPMGLPEMAQALDELE